MCKTLAGKLITPGIVILYALSPAVSLQLKPNSYEGGRMKDERDTELRNSSAFASILGEVRTNISDLMFIKTERYLHSGIAYMPHIDMDKAAQSGEISDKASVGADFTKRFEAHESEVGPVRDHDHDHDGDGVQDHAHEDHEDEHTATLIPAPDADFRGFVGYLHRQVKPWRDPSLPHIHTTGQELLPWYRLMTFTDPKNVRAYLIGTWWLKTRHTEVHDKEALAFITEGVKNNPRAFQLHKMKGDILLHLKQENEARETYRVAGDLAAEIRPHDQINQLLAEGKEIFLPHWTEYNEEDARASVRMAVFTEHDFGTREKALELAIRYNEAFGGDGRLEAQILELSKPPAAE